jgi:hypothetical protein
MATLHQIQNRIRRNIGASDARLARSRGFRSGSVRTFSRGADRTTVIRQPLSRDEGLAWTKDPLRFVGVVGAAPELNPVYGWLPAQGIGFDMMEFEKAGLLATPAILGHKGAPPAVPLPDLALHLRRDVA